jgi:hypothetical protein
MDPIPIQLASIIPIKTQGVSALPGSAKSDCVLILRDLTIPIEINAKRKTKIILR